MSKILMWGAGAIGGSIGAYLKRAGHDVTFVDIAAEHVAAINDPGRGLRVSTSGEEFALSAPAFLPGELTGQWRYACLAVKGQHTEAAATALRAHLAKDGCVVSLQNGLLAPVVERALGGQRTLAASVNVAADMLGPGHICLGAKGTLMIGEFSGGVSERARELAQILRDFDPTIEATADIWSYVWGKLGFALMLTAQALGQRPIIECFQEPELLPLWRALGTEIAALAAAQGIRPHAFDGYDPDAFSIHVREAVTLASIEAMVRFLRTSTKTHSGIWRDLAVHRRRTEIHHQLGPLLELGVRHQIPCTTIRRLIDAIADIEEGRCQQTDDNLITLVRRQDVRDAVLNSSWGNDGH